MSEVFMLTRPNLYRMLVVGLAFMPLVAAAQLPLPLDRENVPAELRGWAQWAIRNNAQKLCPRLNGIEQSWRCAWPGALELSLDDEGGRFTTTWTLYREQPVPLPGGVEHWPHEVLVDSVAVAVVGHDGPPAVELAAGVHRLAGRLTWPVLPESLRLPLATGIVRLQVRGRAVDFPRIEDGRLLLAQTLSQDQDPAREHLELSVHRRLHDSVPVVLTTRLLLDVGGPAREVVLAPALPDGFIALGLTSPLPARLETDGRLRLQVRAGRWELFIEARHRGPLRATGMAKPDGLWSRNEVWVVAADPAARVAQVEGVAATDPRQTALPPEWQSLPAYRLLPGDELQFVEKRRGDSDPAPDALTLDRRIWLDFDGRGYTFQDLLGGRLTRSRRLEMGAETTLGRVALGGADQFITRVPGSSGSGVEIRQSELTAVAESRIEGSGHTLPAVGWDHDFDSVAARLDLPPGWRLLAVTGVDRVERVDRALGVRRSRFPSWTLLDLFLCCIVVMAILNLRGRGWAAIAVLTLALTWREPQALQWSWLLLLAALALAEKLPMRRGQVFGRWLVRAMLAILLIAAPPFLLREAQLALHPVMARPYPSLGSETDLDREPDSLAAEFAIANGMQWGGPLPGDRPSAPDQVKELQAVVQTGPGVPSWSWERLYLFWNGPVQRDQQLRLFLIPPWLNRILGLLRCGLVIAVLIGLLRPRQGSWRGLLPRSGAAVALALLVPALTLVAEPAAAQGTFPPAEVLDDLTKRLLAAPACAPDCADLAAMTLVLQDDGLELRLTVHAIVEGAVPLPGGVAQWLPRQVLLDGRPAPGLLREGQPLWVLVSAGVHQIQLSGQVPPGGVFHLPLPLVPRRVTVTARGWRVDGVHSDGTVDEVLQLSRTAEAGTRSEPTATLSAGELAPYLTITRTLDLRLTWEVHTTVARLSPAETPIVIEVPLLVGESVTTAGIRSEAGRVLVNMAPGAAGLSWDSALAGSAEIRLVAPATDGWCERWRVMASPIWHLETAGIPPIVAPPDADQRVPEWRPWPAEELTLRLNRPGGVGGATLTIDGSVLEVEPGSRATSVVLDLDLRTSRGGSHELLLPPTARLTSLTLNGQSLPPRQEERAVRVQLSPGRQKVHLEWRQEGGMGTLFRTPEIAIGAPSVNARLKLSVPYGRWLLLMSGPRLGPGVRFWSLFLFLGLAAVALGHLRQVPLRTWHWLLLLLGLSQFSFGLDGSWQPAWVRVTAAMIVIGWFLALAWRQQRGETLNGPGFDFTQLILAGWTVASLLVLFIVICNGLLGRPEMFVAGNQSVRWTLNWFQDRCQPTLPQATVLSLPLLAFQLTMLAWALWLAAALLGWLRWAWQAFSSGALWKPLRRAAPPEPETGPDQATATANEETDPEDRGRKEEDAPDDVG